MWPPLIQTCASPSQPLLPQLLLCVVMFTPLDPRASDTPVPVSEAFQSLRTPGKTVSQSPDTPSEMTSVREDDVFAQCEPEEELPHCLKCVGVAVARQVPALDADCHGGREIGHVDRHERGTLGAAESAAGGDERACDRRRGCRGRQVEVQR